jgi:alpha-mannosidase
MSSATRVIVVPHTHWDREWYEPEARFRQRLVELLDDVISRLEQDGSGRFLLDGQTVLLEDYLQVRPEHSARVQALVRGGQLVVGPWYVLADEQLTSDETLVRNLLTGRADGRRHGGWMPVGYSPDAFGHPAALPTILAGFGIEHAMVLRGYGGEAGQERDLFNWVGPDGSAVLTYHFPPAGFEVAANLPEDRDTLAQRWAEIREMLEARATLPLLLAMNGADHHSLQPGIEKITAWLNDHAPGYDFALGSPADYFAALPQRTEAPEVRGELRFSPRYSWVLQGALSARAHLKQAIAECDRLLLRWAEPQAALALVEGGTDRAPLLAGAWREHLQSTFHDTFCGTTSDAVARDAAAREERVATQARGILLDALHDRLGLDRREARRHPQSWAPALAVVNPSAHSRRGVVEATLTVSRRRLVVGRPDEAAAGRVAAWPAPPVLVGSDGTVVPLQVLEWYRAYQRLDSAADYPAQDEAAAFRVAFRSNALPALGLRTFAVRHGGTPTATDDRVWVSGRRVTGATVEVDESPRGGFAVSMREPERELSDIASLVSERDDGDTYSFEPVGGDTPVTARWGPTRAVWEGPLVAATAREFTLGDRARGAVFARLDAGSHLVRFVVQGVNLRGGHRLRVVFPLPRGAADSALVDTQYGPVWRAQQAFDRTSYPREWPVSTAPMQRYVSVPGGFTVFTRGLFEYEITPQGAVAVTLLRAVDELSRGNLRARPGHAAWPAATPAARELGGFRAEFALAGHAVDVDDAPDGWAAMERLAEEFHAPLAGLMLPYGTTLPDVVEGPELSGAGLGFKAAKPSEDGSALVLRCVNLTERAATGSWSLPFDIERAWWARLDETRLREVTPTAGERRIDFTAGPREVVTLVVERLALTEL